MRYDKYEPYGGGFRAPLAADWIAGDLSKGFGVGLDVNGRIVKGAGNTGIVGILVLTKVRKAKDIVDIMTDGECVDSALLPGTTYYADAVTGVLSVTATAPAVRVGSTVSANRLIVRVAGRNS